MNISPGFVFLDLISIRYYCLLNLMKKLSYPEWVYKFKTKGTTVKKVGNRYYLYETTSKRVPGKKYPQPIEKYIGAIDEEKGLIKKKVRSNS